MYLLGIDLGSSSVKVSILEINSGVVLKSVSYPKEELPIQSKKPGWAEQDPESWYQTLKAALAELNKQSVVRSEYISAIGIAYQMHGLVLLDKKGKVLRPSIIWCDSRAVAIGEKAFQEIGPKQCLEHLLNSPGNFTAAKLAWVKEHEPQVYEKIDKVLLPGDYLTYRLSGELNTTSSALSEGVFWDFKKHQLAQFLMDHWGFDTSFIPDRVPAIGLQAQVSSQAAADLGLKAGTPITYRAGDQPNNAYALKAIAPGDMVANGGTSGVVYGLADRLVYDPKSRINSFAHVNHSKDRIRVGSLLCINGTGILYNWMRKQVGQSQLSYEAMNRMAAEASMGSEGLLMLPFGNGAERVLENKNPGASLHGLDLNRHQSGHLFRAALEGIAFSFRYGLEIMESMGLKAKVLRAGHANLFLSPVFRETLSASTGLEIRLYNTDGSQGAARGAGEGAGIFSDRSEIYKGLNHIQSVRPKSQVPKALEDAYGRWKEQVEERKLE